MTEPLSGCKHEGATAALVCGAAAANCLCHYVVNPHAGATAGSNMHLCAHVQPLVSLTLLQGQHMLQEPGQHPAAAVASVLKIHQTHTFQNFIQCPRAKDTSKQTQTCAHIQHTVPSKSYSLHK